jgi:hypothetical protein
MLCFMGEILYKLSLDFSFNEWKAYIIFQEQKITKKTMSPLSSNLYNHGGYIKSKTRIWKNIKQSSRN